MTSAGNAGSATWKVVGRGDVEDAAGNAPGVATIHVSDEPPAAALVPPELTTVWASLLKTSSAIPLLGRPVLDVELYRRRARHRRWREVPAARLGGSVTYSSESAFISRKRASEAFPTELCCAQCPRNGWPSARKLPAARIPVLG